MKPLIRFVAVFALGFSLYGAEPKVILISIDGLKGTTLASLPQRKLNTPNLNEFVEKGAVSEGLEGVFPTVTYPSHTTLVTGRSPAAHGIVGNTLFDPEHTMNGAWYWYAEQIKVPTLWDAARQKGLRTAAVSWPVTVGATIDINFPEFRFPARTIEDRMLFRVLSTPGLVAEFERVDGELPLTGHDDHLRARMATYLIRTRKPDLLLVHFIDLDLKEHSYGPDAPEAFRVLEAIDDCLGLIRKEVRNAGMEQQTVFVIVSDHGFWPVQKAFNPGAVLTALGLAGSDDQKANWRVAAYSNGGSFALIARDPNDREAIDLATKTFQRLQEEGIWGLGKIALRKELDLAQAYSGAFLAASMSEGYMVSYSAAPASWVTPSGSTRGTHGFWPGPVDLDASFAAFGNGIPAKRLPRGKLVDVAPTIAKLLGLTMTGVEGKNLIP